MQRWPRWSVLTLCLGLGLAMPAAAQSASGTHDPTEQPDPSVAPPSTPGTRLFLSSLTVLRYNPLGLETQNKLIYQKRLYENASPVLRDNFVNAAASIKLSPAGMKVGPVVELQPISMVNLRGGYEFLGFFGTFGLLQSYPNRFQDYSDDARDATEDSAYSTTGHHFFFEPLVQAKVGPVALRSRLILDYWNVKLHSGNDTFYEPTLDTLVPRKGWVISNDTDLIYMRGQWVLGARMSGVWPRYGESEPQTSPGGRLSGDNDHLRVGPLVAYTLNTREGTGFNRPTVLAIAGWYLKHPNRQEALPYVLVGFSFTSDLMRAR